MKKDALRAAVAFAVLVIMYLLIVMLIPFEREEAFWVSFGFTLAAFAVVGGAFYIAFVKNPDARSKFYGFPVARLGAIYGAVQLVAGLLVMAIGEWLPLWLVKLVFSLMLGAAILGLISTEAVVDEIRVQDQKLKMDVTLMRGLQSKVNRMVAQCANADAARALRAFAEELRYSDPVSSEALIGIQTDLCEAVSELEKAVVEGDSYAVKVLCTRATAILAERNRLCKLNKG